VLSEVKIFRVEGEITKSGYNSKFTKELRALKIEDALEKVYAEIGSQHRTKRVHIKILSVQEIKPEETEDSIVRELSGVGRT
jgi:large subunit ribosomal protein LX